MNLLHERLREDHGYNTDIEAGRYKAFVSKTFARAMADEIERDYIPKAVDDNGEVLNIYDQCLYEDDFAYVVGFCKDNGVLVFCKGCYCIVAGDRLKRMDYRPSIEDMHEGMRQYAHSRSLDSVTDGWVKDLTAYIDQQGKDER